MQRKKILAILLSMTIAASVPGSIIAEDAGSETSAPQTTAPATEAPQTSAPATEAPQTTAPATEAPQTSAPSTEPSTQPSTPGETQTEPSTQPSTPGETQTEPSTQPSTPGETQTEAASEKTETNETTLPGETQVTEDQSDSGSIAESESESEAQSETETEESESETDPPEEESESETSEFDNNEDLIAHQNIIIPPKLELEFRFTRIEKRYALACLSEGVSIYEEKSESAREVGVLEYYGLCFILEDKGDGWYYVESGNVRGFLRSEEVRTDEIAERIVKVKGIEDLTSARLTVSRTENSAFTYTHTTVQEVMADKKYAIAASDLVIYEMRKDGSRTVGTLEKGGLCYILADEEKDWIFVESGDARGFVQKNQLLTGSAASAKVSAVGEKNLASAVLKIKPEENKSCYYTLTSVKEASQEAKTREAIVNFALQFLGNPYVWGGTSLTNGADCSGFVQSVYAYFGYSLPRVADAQSVYGMQIPISSAEPGDLIFYAKNGYVYHVSMYIGNGQVVHASGRKVGIITSGISGNAVWATRIING